VVPRGHFGAIRVRSSLVPEADHRREPPRRLRDGLMFHDGTKVVARDCVASIRRWGVRDGFGQTLLERTDELSAPDDRTIVFRLRARIAQARGDAATLRHPLHYPEVARR
jgi:hypothetical protein